MNISKIIKTFKESTEKDPRFIICSYDMYKELKEHPDFINFMFSDVKFYVNTGLNPKSIYIG